MILKDITFFKDVTSSIRNDILPFLEAIELKTNEILLKKESSPSIYILVQGTIKKSIYAPWNSYKVLFRY